jgi:hypothetical protein
MIKQKAKWTSVFILLLFFSTSFLGLSKALNHSLDSVSSLLHFHISTSDIDHHQDSNDSHSNEENETMIRLDQSITKKTSYPLDLTLVIFSAPHTSQLHFDSKDYAGKLSGADPPINRMDFRSFYPNAPPSLA